MWAYCCLWAVASAAVRRVCAVDVRHRVKRGQCQSVDDLHERLNTALDNDYIVEHVESDCAGVWYNGAHRTCRRRRIPDHDDGRPIVAPPILLSQTERLYRINHASVRTSDLAQLTVIMVTTYYPMTSVHFPLTPIRSLLNVVCMLSSFSFCIKMHFLLELMTISGHLILHKILLWWCCDFDMLISVWFYLINKITLKVVKFCYLTRISKLL